MVLLLQLISHALLWFMWGLSVADPPLGASAQLSQHSWPMEPCLSLCPCMAGHTRVLLIVTKVTDMLGIRFFRRNPGPFWGRGGPWAVRARDGLRVIRQTLRVKVSWNFLFKHVLLQVWNKICANMLAGPETRMVSFKTWVGQPFARKDLLTGIS